jgi:hypothetical protein
MPKSLAVDVLLSSFLYFLGAKSKILDFTKQLAPTQHGVTYYTFNHSLEGADMSLEVGTFK